LFRYTLEAIDPDDLDFEELQDIDPDELFEPPLDDEFRAPKLALALLTDALGDADVAHALHQGFLYQVVNRLPNDWSMTLQEIREFLSVGILPRCLG
jgi:hypothetical protein